MSLLNIPRHRILSTRLDSTPIFYELTIINLGISFIRFSPISIRISIKSQNHNKDGYIQLQHTGIS